MIHGTRRSYRRGCHCDDCTRANTRYTKRLRMEHNAGQTRTIDSTGTRRRILALGCMDWPYAAIAAEIGTTKGNVAHLICVPHRKVTRETAATIRAVYDRLSMTRGPADRRTAAAARRNGGYPPLAWDDDTIDDPAARPCLGRGERGQDIADIELLIDDGGTWESIPIRLGVSRDGLGAALRRAGRLDLIARLTRRTEAA